MYSVIAWFPIRCAVSIAVHVVAKRIQRREQRSRGPPSGSTKALLDRAAESGVQLTQFEAEGMLLECEGHVGQALNRVKRGKRPRVLLDYAYAEARLGLPAAAAFMVVTLGLLLRAVLVLQVRTATIEIQWHISKNNSLDLVLWMAPAEPVYRRMPPKRTMFNS
eukprot:scaffold163783_cov32-Tisochrysis_lutea.AAC.3